MIRFDGHSRSGVLTETETETETAVRLWVSQAEVDAG
ncbi:hypothetical protein M2271_002260 [Streptomyces sp. LBL]|nr:hypothetical protein [Streptomyces sp. LBL]